MSDQKIHATDPGWRDALTIFDASLVSASRDAAAFILSPDPLGLPSLQHAAPRTGDDDAE
ncbi:MAG: hypothetical protein HY547_07725 [Elusimicrobia bacterium]|nr:hypothetical protein [Elusimicrobiota bacterium]